MVSKSQLGGYYPLTDRGHVIQSINDLKRIDPSKFAAAKDFLLSYDQ
jgi:hypothetical protein